MTASCVSHPIDLLKVRKQLQGEGSRSGNIPLSQVAKEIYAAQGVRGFYQGLSASLLRQLLFSSNRHGGYGVLLHYRMEAKNGGTQNAQVTTTDKYEVSLFERICCGVIAGSLSALLANPADVVLVRMQSDGSKPEHLRRNYKHAFHGIKTIIQTEGIRQLWRGCGPTVARATLITSVQLSAYDVSKNFLLSTGFFKNNQLLYGTSSLITAFLASVVTAPVDLIKTRMMNSQTYSSSFDCILKIISREGSASLFKGFTPAFMRLAPHNLVLWLTMEQTQKLLRHYS